MFMLPTTTVTVYRGEGTDEYGDPIDLDIVHLSGVPANFSNLKVSAKTESSTMPQVLYTADCRVRAGLDINENDRLKDEKSGEYWQIVATSRPQNPAVQPELRLHLLRLNSSV